MFILSYKHKLNILIYRLREKQDFKISVSLKLTKKKVYSKGKRL